MNDLENVDLLITGGTVLTLNPACPMISRGAVAVCGDVIAAVGPADNFAGVHATEILDADGGIILPGLVNTHTHLPMTLFRGLADDLPLETWLNDHIFPAEARFITPETVRWGTLLACAEMILSGTTCCCDGYFYEDTVAAAVADAGMRGVLGQAVIGFPAPGVSDPKTGIDHAVNYIRQWQGRSPRIHPSILCHAPYTCDDDTLKTAKAMANDLGVLFHIHVAETRFERDQSIKQKGESPVRHLARLGVLDANTLLIHCVWLDEADMDCVRQHGAAVAHCPESNMKLASGVAPIPDLLSRGVCVGLGTDGCASNNDLDLFAEMDMAAKLHKVHRLDPTVMDAATVLKMATIDGASAIGMADRIGSLEVGKQADIIVVDTKKPHLTPCFDPVSHLVYAATSADVRHVLVDGKLLLRDRRLLTVDMAEVMGKVNAIAGAIRS
ncbi:amidohydrolase [Desulfosarcina sp. OttesenSCG-928-G10]|nr:amidohydrolase [Desulfosarcina sp. OttesenSCG-928-G10]MDL2321935.1 amidohydrolase [Desulfosarcina sp. OttesenSCG-928-B08]